jgi:hypothetical protein
MYRSKDKCKIIAFDLDETLGQFSQFGLFIDVIKHYKQRKITQSHFFQLCDIYYKYFRPNIFELFEYIRTKKERHGMNIKTVLFTNNQGPKEWSQSICDYINHRLKYPLFEDVIGAYKVKNTIQEERRTSNIKLQTDLIKILECDSNTEILFFDDVYHPEMDTLFVTYYHNDPYYYQYPTNELISLYLSHFTVDSPTVFEHFMRKVFEKRYFKHEKHIITPNDYKTTHNMYETLKQFLAPQYGSGRKYNETRKTRRKKEHRKKLYTNTKYNKHRRTHLKNKLLFKLTQKRKKRKTRNKNKTRKNNMNL